MRTVLTPGGTIKVFTEHGSLNTMDAVARVTSVMAGVSVLVVVDDEVRVAVAVHEGVAVGERE